MNKRLLIAVLLGWAVLAQAQAPQLATARVKVFLRAAPDLSSPIVGVIAKDAEVEILESHGGFRRVRLVADGTQGFLRARMLSQSAAAVASASAPPAAVAPPQAAALPAPQTALETLQSPTPAARARQSREAEVQREAPRAELRPAAVTGPQSTVETYETPVLTPTPGEIEFPDLLADPAVEDGRRILDKLRRLRVEFVNRPPKLHGGEFLSFVGDSAVADREQLYAAIRAKITVYRDLPLTLGDVRFLQLDITEVYRERGYPLMSVFVPPQEIEDGALRLQINEFSLAAYTVAYADGDGAFAADNRHWSDEGKLRQQLEPLLAEPVLSRQALDRRVKRISQNPYRQARVVFEPGREVGDSVASIQITEQKPWGLNFGYSNHATESSGTNRYSLGGNFGNLPAEGHQMTFNSTFGDVVEEFANYSLVYRIPLAIGHALTFNGNYSDTASSSIPGVGSASTTLQTSVAWDFPLFAAGGLDATGNLTLFSKNFERESQFGGQGVGGSTFDGYNAVLRTVLNAKESTATNQLTFTATQSFEGLGGDNTAAAFREFYNRADGSAAYTFFGLNYARVQQLPVLGEGWSTETQLSYQQAGAALAGSDQFAAGGAQVLRAYESSTLAGDRGEYLTQMFSFPALNQDHFGAAGRLIQSVRFSLFGEWAQVHADAGGSDTLWDYGLQLRATLLNKMNCTGSLAQASDAAGITEADELRVFLACSIQA